MFCLQGNKGDTSMFLEDVLPHLRAGGKVRYLHGSELRTTSDLIEVLNLNASNLASYNFDIINEHCKKGKDDK